MKESKRRETEKKYLMHEVKRRERYKKLFRKKISRHSNELNVNSKKKKTSLP